LGPGKPIDLPPEVAKAFVRDMRAFLAATDSIKKDEIAARQRHLLLEHMPKGSKLRLIDVREMFVQMKDQA
jgi:hypothetical protein